MILRLLTSLQADLDSFTVGDPRGANMFVAKMKAVQGGKREGEKANGRV